MPIESLKRLSLALVVAAGATTLAGAAPAQPVPRTALATQPAAAQTAATRLVTSQTVGSAVRLVPFTEFRAGLSTEQATAYIARADLRVRVAGNFEEMRQHLISLYGPVQATHSFQLETDTYDCIPINQQPSVRLQGITQIATPPPPLPSATAATAPGVTGRLDAARVDLAANAIVARQPTQDAVQVGAVTAVDRFGNSTRCETGTIPLRRVTLEEMSRFGSLHDFLSKGITELPPSAATTAPCSASSCVHKYSVFHQSVNNWGGNSSINVWSPSIDTSHDESFSLTQQWYVGGSGTSLPGLQTVEVGWQNYPQKYGDQRARLFIYHTADGYNNTGCYNLDCGDFVQTDNSVYIGGGFTNYSAAGGGQWEMAIQVQFYRGNWWIFYGNKPFGYYPGSLFHGGQLTHYATDAQFGTETTGSSIWPGAGSGAAATGGFGHAAYQRNVFYINTSAGGVWSTLSSLVIAPCYGLNGPSNGGGAWTVYFYDGGAGGRAC